MKSLRYVVIIGLVALVAVFLAAPSAMAKKQLTEAELDMVTAAGEPTVITASLTITYSDSTGTTLMIPTNAQTGMQALEVNNLVGEQQLANALNVESTSGAAGASQRNRITQSWGATHDISSSFMTVAGVSVPGTSAPAIGGSSIAAACGLSGSNHCDGLITQSGNGGNAIASTSPGSVKSGKILASVLSDYGDVILTSTGGSVTDTVDPSYSLLLEAGAQNNLLALVVNNVSGMSQLANATNIAGGVLTYNNAGNGFINGAQNVSATASQSNTINQFRGTPYSRPAAPTGGI